MRTRIVIVGAAGRDFHDFNVVYREDPAIEVVAFTAAQIPGIADRVYPASLAGPLYPDGIPIRPESDLDTLCRDEAVDRVVFAYSDVTHAHVMHIASRALAAGADFELLAPERTWLASHLKVVAICAVRTGAGKSQTARHVARHLRGLGRRVAVLRHPMPYGDLARQRVQRFASTADLAAADCTAEEREEYEPHIAAGGVVFAGVDYAAILETAEAEADIIVWDGGNNDLPLIRPDLLIGVVDALRPDHIATHHPGETVARRADIAVIAKCNAATPDQIAMAERGLRAVNPRADVVYGASPIRLDGDVRGRRVIVVEDGPTITHGGMAHGAGHAAATASGAIILDPRAHASPELRAVYDAYPHIGRVLPAVGYSAAQIEGLRRTILDSDAECVIAGTPIDLAALLRINRPVYRARYDYADTGAPTLTSLIDRWLG